MKTSIYSITALCLIALAFGCRTTPKSAEAKEDLKSGAARAVERMTAADSDLQAVIDSGHGYAAFPKIGKGGVIVGGAYGRGIVYEQDTMIGFADMTQASIGAQLGGQTYSELIVFENKAALDRFRQNKLEVSANASAVILEEGAAKAATFENGVAIFIQPRAGAMAEASVGGQKFTFVADENARRNATTRSAM